jgi:hypothetical protein
MLSLAPNTTHGRPFVRAPCMPALLVPGCKPRAFSDKRRVREARLDVMRERASRKDVNVNLKTRNTRLENKEVIFPKLQDDR